MRISRGLRGLCAFQGVRDCTAEAFMVRVNRPYLKGVLYVNVCNRWVNITTF
jgi:hypothetical protein